MKSIKVKKSPEVLGLSKKSKDSFKIKKTPKPSLSISKKNVISKHLPESDTDVKVKILHKKQSHKLEQNSPKKVILKKGTGKTNDNKSSTKKITPKKEKKRKKASLKKEKAKTLKNNDNKSSPSKALLDSKRVEKSPVSVQKVNYIDSKQILPAAQALLTHCKTKNKKALFKSEGTPIFVQFEAIAAPKHPKTTLRLALTHSTHSKVSDVLLIITDEKKHHRKLRHDDEPYIINFTEKLKELGVTQVSKVMTLRQIRAEYYTHEMRRKLSDMFDVFLCDGKVAKKLSSLIGKNFFLKRKSPIPVGLEKEDKIKLNIDRALRKTEIVLKSTSCSNSVVRIGNTDMKAEEIAENLEAFSKAMDTCKYPGGWRNVKAVHIKTPTSTSFPVYYSYLTPNEIETAELKQTLPKHSVAVKGELSTIGRDVIVRPDGTIEVEGVDDMRSLMHQLYKHSGFKDSETLDLTDAEYKEVVRELEKHTAKKAKTEDRNATSEADVADMLVDNESSDEDDNTIQGEIQGDEENDDEDFGDSSDEEKEEKGDGVEASYMQEWQQTWLNQSSDEEQDEDKQKDKKKKNIKNQGKLVQQQQGKISKKRQQKTESVQGGKKQKTDTQKPKKADQQTGNAKQNKKTDKRADKAKNNKKNTPLRKAGGVKIDSSENVVQKKKAKKSRSNAPNYMAL